MAFADVLDLFDYWSASPPVNELLASFLGVKPADKPRTTDPDDPGGIGTLIAAFPGGVIGNSFS